MNLAELRKKAQKQNRAVALCIAAPPALDVLEEVMHEEETEETVIYRAADAPPETDASPVEVPEPQVVLVQSANGVALFDPLAVLLAGREAAALADEAAFTDAGISAGPGADEFQEFLCFRVASEIYAINIMNIKEIIKPRDVTEVPRAPSFVSGVLSLRGIIIPIFNMRLRLGLAGAEPSAKERIVVLKKAEEFFGVLVDEVIQVVKIASATIEKPPVVLEGVDRDFVQGIGRFESQMLILLNQEKILDLTLC